MRTEIEHLVNVSQLIVNDGHVNGFGSYARRELHFANDVSVIAPWRRGPVHLRTGLQPCCIVRYKSRRDRSRSITRAVNCKSYPRAAFAHVVGRGVELNNCIRTGKAKTSGMEDNEVRNLIL